MSSAKAQFKVRLVRSENKWGRSNRRHFARQNRRKKTSDQYERNSKMYNLVSMVQTVGYHVLQVIQKARDGAVYSVRGWDTAYQRFQRTAKQFMTGYDGQSPSRTFKPM